MNLCPHHDGNLRWRQCTPGFTGCEVAAAREIAKQHGGFLRKIEIPADVATMDLSRQRKLQIAWKRLGLCIQCGRERDPNSSNYCTRDMIASRERQRARLGCQRRNKGAKSYSGEMAKANQGAGI